MNDVANPTIEDVARLAGVSTATVSRVLNDSEAVRPETRDKVQLVIKELGYSPNFGARSLVERRTRIIGAVIPTMDNAIFATGLQAFQETLDEEGFTLLVSSSSYQKELEERQIYNLVSRGVDALLLIGHDRDPAIYEFLKKRGLPYVISWNYRETNEHTYIGFDNYGSGRDMVNLVISKGRTNIAILAGITTDNDRARDRLDGMKEALAQNKIIVGENAIIEVPYELEAAGNAFEKLVKNVNPDAVICGNDVIAVGAIQKARELGIDVPDDIAITGFDDLEIARITSPRITTVHVPHRKMGEYAALSILKSLKNNEPAQSVNLGSYIIERESL